MSVSTRAADRGGMAESLRLLGDLGTTMPMMVALHVLAFSGPQTVTALSEHLGLSPSATSHLLQRLVELRLATREDDEADRRRRLLAITARGHRAVAELMEARLSELRASLAPLAPTTLRLLHAALASVLEDLSRAAHPLCPPRESATHSRRDARRRKSSATTSSAGRTRTLREKS
jgi:DNA-binding MarR family transcriptional regulator